MKYESNIFHDFVNDCYLNIESITIVEIIILSRRISFQFFSAKEEEEEYLTKTFKLVERH